MSNEYDSEHFAEQPEPPYTRIPGLFEGWPCAECGEQLVPAADQRGRGWYVHQEEIEE